MNILVLLATAATIFVNYLSNALPIAGRTPKQVSDMYLTSFTPAGYTFAIWGIIYLGLIAFNIYQVLPSQRLNSTIAAIRLPYVISCLLNIVWIFSWHNLLIPISLLLMVGLLVTLIIINLRIPLNASGANFWLLRLPFSVYLGWITVATVANTSNTLVWLGWRGAPIAEGTWAAILVLVAASIGVAMSRLRQDVAYNLVLLWAFYGILGESGRNDATVRVGLLIGVIVVLLGLIGFVFAKPKQTIAG